MLTCFFFFLFIYSKAKLRLEQEQKEQELLKEKQELLRKKREEKRKEKEVRIQLLIHLIILQKVFCCPTLSFESVFDFMGSRMAST